MSNQIDQWVVQAQAGDSAAFGKIYDEYVKPIYRYIYYRVSESIAEDLTEDTFLKAWKNLKKYKKGKHPFSSWLFRIAHNLVVDHYRKNKVSVEMIDETIEDTQKTPSQKTNLKLNQVRLHKIIKKLPDNYQQVIILKYINELDNPEVAAAMGKSEGAIRTLQHRALEKLRGLLENESDFL